MHFHYYLSKSYILIQIQQQATMSFDLEKFTHEPSVELLNLGKKPDLLNLAKHYELKEVKSSLRKHEIKNILVQYFVDEDIFDEKALSLIVDVPSVSSSRDLELLKLQQREKELEIEREREERKFQEKQLEIEIERERAQREIEEKERERQFQREKEEREREREREKEEREREEREIEREREREERAFQLRLKELEIQDRANQPRDMYNDHFDVTKHFRLVPQFQENEVDTYFEHFEKVANNLKWPKEQWTLLLQSVLVGKARNIYSQLRTEQSNDYDTVKELILKGYELVPEAYRQQFRSCRKESGQTHVEFARNEEKLFDRWCYSKKIDQNYDNLRQLILIEQFKNCIQSDIKSHLDEKTVETIHEAARLADDYYLTHKNSFVNKAKPASSHPQNKSMSGDSSSMSSQSNSPKPKSTGETNVQNPLSRVHCTFCKKPGHLISECFRLKRKKELSAAKPTGLTSLQPKSQPSFELNSIVKAEPNSDSCMEIFEPFILDGFVSLSGDMCPPTPIKILRDTGASQSLILADVLPFSEKTSSGTSVLIQGVECGVINVPLHKVNLSSDLVTGSVVVGVKHSLPFKGVHLLLGNDLAGDKVVVNPLVTDTPNVGQTDDPILQEIPDLYPSCAVTRGMAKKASLKNSNDIDLTDTFVGQYFNDEIKKSFNLSLPDTQTDSSKFCQSSPRSNDQGHETHSKSKLIQEQQNDPEISKLIDRALPEKEMSQNPVCYYKKNGILMRKWRPFDVPADDDWAVHHQIVVPKSYRHEILSIAHESPMSGHLGVNKTYHKIMTHFFWPGLKSDVSKYCKSCHTCQMVGKPNQVIPKARLQPIPAFDEPFSRIIIDCVGPLPKTKSGSEYLLTIMCASTRFPEAIPLRNIKAKSIIKALVKFFTFVGLPKSVQSDQGSNFMSGIFQQVMHELGIKQYRSSAYHPESQGALERFHQTLKNMIRSYCFDTDKNWDEGIHLLLFAVRESVQESLGFSPFELVFGHSVRGPLTLLKEKFLADDETPLNLLQYVSDFRNKLSRACEVARSNLKSSQSKMKARYDKHSVDRKFEPGDKVLALLPIPGRPLQARYYGPYTIDKKTSDLNYIINTPGRRKNKQMCHVNMLKKYFDRDSSISKPVTVVNTVPQQSNMIESEVSSDFSEKSVPGPPKLENSEILKNLDDKLSHLEPSQREELKQLINEYKHLFPDIPTRTDKIYHDVIVEDSQPIKQHPYRMNPVKQKALQDEVNYLLENDFIEPSQSNYSSPCILVPKPNGTYRMCTDYRKVNSVTKTDSFPIPRIDDCIDKVGNSKYVTKFDLLKGFWQVPLTDRAKEVSAFATPTGLYQYKVMPFGMKNSPATFQRLVNMVIAGLDGCDAYIDDVIIYTDTWSDHLQRIKQFFDRLSEAKLTVNLGKTEFCHATVTFLGHLVGQGQVKPLESKVNAISEFPVPATKKQLMRFLGMAGYYRKFCKNFSIIAEPLTNLLKKNVKFKWNDNCQVAFDRLKAILKSTPVLLAPDFDKCFKLAVDASDVGIGAVLLQEDDDGIDHPVCYFSKKLNKHQKNYSTIEKECLALILAIQHFEVYLTSATSPIVVFSDHNPLSFLHKLKSKNQRLLRWSLSLQEFDLDVRHIKGKDNIIPDALSRV